jgi:hypothetical protein
MSFYIRKAVRAGPIRLNLSKSGVGTSVGVTGFRVGSGPRGNYVHTGRYGLYYRKFFGAGPPETPPRKVDGYLRTSIRIIKEYPGIFTVTFLILLALELSPIPLFLCILVLAHHRRAAQRDL